MATIKMEVIGNMGADAVVNHETKKVIFSVAGDTYKEVTTWVTCFMSYKEECPKVVEFLKKGACVSVIGRPSINVYEGKTNFNLNADANNITIVMPAKKKATPEQATEEVAEQPEPSQN